MKIVIDIDEDIYNHIKNNYIVFNGMRTGKTFMAIIYNAIGKGTPLPKGHWIKHHNDNLGRCMRDNLECSVCGKRMCESPYQSFCPSCGADMRGDE